MANGADRIFGIVKNTSEKTNLKPSEVISLRVKSINPIILTRDDKLEITQDFCVFSKYIDIADIKVNDILTAFTFNDGQVYFINENQSSQYTTATEINIGTSTPSHNEVVWFKQGKNLVRELINGLDVYSGHLDISSTYCCTGYIEIVADTYYYASGFSSSIKWWYDENFNYISNTLNNPAKSPINAKYIVMSSKIAQLNNPMIIQSDTAVPYEPYIEKAIYLKNNNGLFENFYNDTTVKYDHYSKGEIRIGTWIDGKPLYRKVIDFVTFTTDYYLGISNVANIISIKGMLHRKDNDGIFSPIPSRLSNTNYSIDFERIDKTAENVDVKILWGSSFSASMIKTVTFIIEYTKNN